MITSIAGRRRGARRGLLRGGVGANYEIPACIFIFGLSPTGCQSTQRATKGFSAHFGPSFRYFIRRNPPMTLRVAYRRVVCLYRLGVVQNAFEVRCVEWGVPGDKEARQRRGAKRDALRV